MHALAHIEKRSPSCTVTRAGAGMLGSWIGKNVLQHLSGGKQSSFEIVITSTGSNAEGWREYWAVQSQRDGTDWVALAWQHIGALSAVRALCASSGASS